VEFKTGGNKECKYQGRYEIWASRKERRAKRGSEEGKEYNTDSVRKCGNKHKVVPEQTMKACRGRERQKAPLIHKSSRFSHRTKISHMKHRDSYVTSTVYFQTNECTTYIY